MIRSYFVIAIRYILRNKIQSIIQILSLTIGITAIIIIGLYVDHELSYDKFNEKIDRIYRLEYGEYAGQQSAIGHQIKENFPEVDNVVRMLRWGGIGDAQIRYISDQGKESERKIELKSQYIACDSTVFDVFTFPFIQGDPASALRDPYSVVLTEHTAREIFGSKDPVGEGLWIGGLTDNTSYTVTGVIHDVENFHIDIDILLSIVSVKDDTAVVKNVLNSYQGGDEFFTYLLLPNHYDVSRTEKNINTYFMDKVKDKYFFQERLTFSIRPLEEIYFSSPLKNEMGYCRHGSLKLLKILSAIAIFILVLACINYINLATARASLRAREVGIRKVSGSLKSSLILQFLVESVIISLVSFLIAITLVQVLLPTFNQLAMIELSLERFFKPGTILLSITGIVLLGFVAGLYPAFYLTTFQPVAFLKGEQPTGIRSVLFRRVLLTFQFAISVILIIGVLTILRQLKYMKTADLGFDKELIVILPAYGNMNWEFHKRQVFKENLLRHPNIQKVAFGWAPGRTEETFTTFFEYNGIKIKPVLLGIDPEYFDLMDIELLQGRNFSWDIKGDYYDRINTETWRGRIIVNETALREFGMVSLEDGDSLIWENGFKLEIIGVVEDINFVSQHHTIEPYFFVWVEPLAEISIKILPNNIQGTIKYIKNVVESMFPEETFVYKFLDDFFDRQYENDEKLARIISNFAIVALLIGCLGLFGLSSFMAARRTKEIGIRKAMGASVRIVFLLLSREFVIWIALSVIIACPVARFVMNKWLQGFAYRTNIGVGTFMLAIVVAFAIAFITVAWHAWKTARTNPVEALRYE